MDKTIVVENLSKQYRIGARQENNSGTLYEAMLTAIRRRLFHWRDERRGELWALKDLSFEVGKGQVIGVIGRNGAGKSTLLKILSRITPPTSGKATIYGRVGSLLEVGTGFHPDLTGRENTYLIGVIMGMRKEEITRRFDEIVAFSGVEKFIDTPLKRYSSGMQMRLGFSVAAHMDTEVLLVDEALAVGDIEFQRKCLNRIKGIASENRTVLFVSHNTAAIDRLTQRCLLLEGGRQIMFSDTRSTVAKYLEKYSARRDIQIGDWPERRAPGIEARFVKFGTEANGVQKQMFRPMEPITITLGVEFRNPIDAEITFTLETDSEHPLFTSHLSDHSKLRTWSGYQEFKVTVSPNFLTQGRYLVSLGVYTPSISNSYEYVDHFPAFEVEGSPETGFFPIVPRDGNLFFPLQWHVDAPVRKVA